ncbi:protein AATF-like [Pocillopora damicornis]|uniref:protein AATF-like n=1 Tax=Pocillopora damicornis TaxID=46731 RepID=UPI000F5532F9|nr:protein AATF-like [Pocillopora damicornis]
MASLAEQLRALSNPEPSRIDLDEDEFDVTRAQTIKKAIDSEDFEDQEAPVANNLRKKTATLLQDVDKKYAGHKISRAQLEASRGHDAGSDEEEEHDEEEESESNSGDYLNGVGKPEDDDDINSKEDNTDGSENQVEGVTFSDDNDDENVDNDEEDSLHSGTENESEEEFSSAGEDSDINGAVGKSDDDDIEEDEDMGNNTIQQFSSTSLKEDIEKGTAAKHQLSLWDSFLEMRIRLQKALLIANRLPQHDQHASLNFSGDKNLKETYKEGRKSVAKLLGNLLWIQEKLLDQNPDTKDILYSGKESSKSAGQRSDEDEEIPSDTEDEKSDNDDEKSDNDDEKSDNDDEKSNNEDDEDDNAGNKDQVNGKQTEGSLKLPAKRKHELSASEYADCICKRHAALKDFRDSTISKWSEKTRLASGKINSKTFGSFDRSALAQINHILSDKGRLTKRTQLKRTSYRVLGKSEKEEIQDMDSNKEQSDLHLKDYDEEIFDDDDFYHQLLREFIEQRTSGNTNNPIEMGRQWLALQKLRRKVKKKVDTKASKGRKIR